MKKLLAFAVIAAMSFGAYAGECSPDELDCGMVWKVRLSARSTDGYARKAPDACSEGFCYRRQRSRRFEGYIHTCACDCEAFQSALTAGDGILWERSKRMIWEDFQGTDDILHRIDARAAGVEILSTFTFGDSSLTAAGFGRIQRSGRNHAMTVTSIRGYFAGTLTKNIVACAPARPDDCSECEAQPAGYWEMCFEDDDDPMTKIDSLIYEDDAPVCGSWTMSLDRRLSERYVDGGMDSVTPAFVQDYEAGL